MSKTFSAARTRVPAFGNVALKHNQFAMEHARVPRGQARALGRRVNQLRDDRQLARFVADTGEAIGAWRLSPVHSGTSKLPAYALWVRLRGVPGPGSRLRVDLEDFETARVGGQC